MDIDYIVDESDIKTSEPPIDHDIDIDEQEGVQWRAPKVCALGCARAAHSNILHTKF